MSTRYSIQDWQDKILEEYGLVRSMFVSIDVPTCPDWAVMYEGMPVYFTGDEFVVFDSCNFCRATKSPIPGLFDGYFCSCCGAEI